MIAPEAKAQIAEPPAGASDAGADDTIIVTARRREESLKSVPISIAALAGADLAKRAIHNENDLQFAVPGLVIRSNGGAHAFNYVVRGQSVDTFSNSPPSVLPYINDVQIVTHSASAFYDMAGIQVLKGPQGTLFGRNATGGAVLYTTVKPQDELGGYVTGRYGNYEARHIDGAINVPLPDGAALRVAASYTGGGAYVRDHFSRAQYGGINQKSVRASLLIRPAPGISNITVGQYSEEDGTNTPYQLWSINACGAMSGGQPLVDAAACTLNRSNPTFQAYLAAHPEVFQGDLADALALQRSLGAWESASTYPPFHQASSRWLINTTEIELSDDVIVKNIFGYNKADSYDGYDYDGSPFHFFQNQGELTPNAVSVVPVDGFTLGTQQISNELQLQGTAFQGRLDYVVGAYFLDEQRSVRSALDSGNFNPIAPPFRFFYTAISKTRSTAGFAQGTYKATEQLSLTGGFRYTWDRTTLRQLPDSLFLQFFPDNPEEKTTASKPSWTVSLDYKLSPDLMAYVAHRGSWRSGGFNYSVAPIPETAAYGGNLFLPETTKDIELGLKYSGDDLGPRVTVNAAFFHQVVNNIQRAAYILTPAGVSLLTANVPRAKITGGELDFSVRLSRWAQFGAAGNYTNARYTSAEINVLGNRLVYGPFADVPKWSGTAFAEIGTSLDDLGAVRFRADLYGQTSMPFSNTGATSSPGTVLPGYVLANARLTWEEMLGSRAQVSLFGRNLFNRQYYTGGMAAAAGGSTNVSNSGMPRTYGVEARVDF